jgi:hypothetical protein
MGKAQEEVEGTMMHLIASQRAKAVAMQPTETIRPTHKWYTRNSITFTLLIAALIVLVLASPFAVRWLAGNRSDWGLLSNVGQTYGFAAALLSGLALLTIAISLSYQSRQTTISQLQAARTLQLELFKMAYEHPDLQESWSSSLDLTYPEWRKRSYMNLIFMYLRMGYIMHETTDDSLRRAMVNRFRTQMGREYWSDARWAFGIDVKNHRDRRFYQIAEQEYQKAIQSSPLEEPNKSTSQQINLRPLLTFTAGCATAAVVSLMFRRRQRHSS